MEKWHIWVIRQSKFEHVKHFIETEVREVSEIFFPTTPKEYRSRNKKKVIKKRIPLYSGYLFLKYEDDNEKTFYKLRANPFFTTYVGLCDESSVDKMRVKESWNTLNKKVEIGDSVEVVGGPMKGCKGTVNSINGNNVTIKSSLFDRKISHTLASEDIEIVNK